MGRKKFIDKNHDVIHSFKLVPRSQKDPLAADETAPQHVLVDLNKETTQKEELHKYGVYFDDDYDYLQHLRGVREMVDWDSYDMEVYTIKNDNASEVSDGRSGLQLPSSMFESHIEEPIGLLNRAAPVTGPRPELDPDIVAELDKEGEDGGDFFSPEDEEGFPDDFVAMLNADEEGSNGHSEETAATGFDSQFDSIKHWLGQTERCRVYPSIAEEDREEIDHTPFQRLCRSRDNSLCSSEGLLSSIEEFGLSGDEEDDEVKDLPMHFRPKGSNTCRSGTSASSATVPRSELLTTLDERFEQLFNEEYAEEQLGALDGDVIEGSFDVNSEVFQQAVRSTWKQLEKLHVSDLDDEDKNRTVHWVKQNLASCHNDEKEEEEIVRVDVKRKPCFDCESILSTYSNSRNLPRIIDDSRLFRKNNKSLLTKKAVREHDNMGADPSDKYSSPVNDPDAATLLSCISAISYRPKDETPEERKDRKSALRELRRERRKEKKLNKLSFKQEMKKQKKLQMNVLASRVVSVI